MKHYKVNIHNKSYANADLVIYGKDFSDIQTGDIVELYHPEDEYNRLLLQITVFKEDLQGKDVVSVEQGVANTFQLRAYSDVVVRKVEFDSVVLDSVEVTFKDQYLGRSEMWRLKNNLVRTCVYLNKKIEFCNGTARVQVHEMWFQGERVTCGAINEETKIVFRSSTSMVYLFIQMSSEMWEFDVHGDLYFEKAVNGFLSDLFQKWKKHGSNHEVTIVLFSRVFYKANSIEEFPDYMRECVQKDYKNQYYEDFYHVAVQNEKYDDWSSCLVLLQSLFIEYRKTVLECHKKIGFKVPLSSLSTAAHGNFLEVLNISLNVFEKHYLDRSLDRTGQLSVVISPGVGVFEVDRELTNVTKQRTIDNGVGCDLVCVGEQPLHAVPLFKFHNKDTSILLDDYSMPHWINLSFYSGDKKQAYSKFVPRIRLPSRRIKTSASYQHLSHTNNKKKLPTSVVEETSLLGCSVSAADVDYEDYDDQIFTLPSSRIASVQKFLTKSRKSSYMQDNKIVKWKLSDPDIYRSHLLSNNDSTILRSNSIAISEARVITGRPRTSFNFTDTDRLQYQEASEDELSAITSNPVGSADSSNSSFSFTGQRNPYSSMNVQNLGNASLGSGKALINPFDPSHVTVKVTSNRRRWTHVFPKDSAGIIIQQHHYQPIYSPDNDYKGKYRLNSENDLNSVTEDDFLVSGLSPTSDSRVRSKTSTFVGSPTSGTFLSQSRKSQTLLWGATGEQQWTPTLTTGVDWKSLVIPACLPITTDFFPDEVSLNNDYLVSNYNLLPDDVNADYARKRAIYRDPLTTQQVFFELISQRLAQGFQLIVENDTSNCPPKNLCPVVSKKTASDKVTEYKLSIGRIFHKISLCKSEIKITRYRPKHPYPPFIIHYRYRFQAPDHLTYGVSRASFNAEKLENYNWNYIDHYICTRGDTDFPLVESCKFWRFRLYALPILQSGTKKILDGSQYCNVYTKNTIEEKKSFLDAFLRFTESAVNKVRRMTPTKSTSKDNLTSQLISRRHSTGIVFLSRSQIFGSTGNNSPYRERGGSINRAARPRSVSKMIEKQKISSISDIFPPMTMSLDPDNCDVFENGPEIPKIKENLTNAELLEILTNPRNGISFISKSPSLPSNTFISYDAVQWIKKHLECDEVNAIQKLEDLRNEKLICHASGDFSHPYICGFYLYYVPRRDEKNSKEREIIDPINDLRTFKNEWAEVEVHQISMDDNPCPIFLRNELPNEEKVPVADQEAIEGYKQAHLEVDANGKSDRIEWGHYQYQCDYNVHQAYELIIQWMAASGPIVSDLIYSLTRKAQTYNVQLVPVPADPHALPYAMKSDPLRGPVFVPLDVTCLWNDENNLFEEYEPESRLQRLLLLQEEIAVKYGFIPCKGSVGSFNHHIQYVHLTGNMFLLITSPLNDYWMDQDYFTQLRSIRETGTNSDSQELIESKISPHQEYIRRHITEYHDDKHIMDQRVGYLWSWNHMIGRRWKGTNSAINDEAFQDKLLRDFRKFCSNDENRLRLFWDECNSLKTSTESRTT